MPRQNYPDDIFKCIFLNESVWISNTIWLTFVPKGRIDIKTALVEIMAWHRTGNKPLSEPMVTYVENAYMRHPAWICYERIFSYPSLVTFHRKTKLLVGRWLQNQWCEVCSSLFIINHLEAAYRNMIIGLWMDIEDESTFRWMLLVAWWSHSWFQIGFI